MATSAICILIASDDAHMSRLDPTLLSQQALMEMFVDAMQNKDRFMHNENYKDISEWQGMTCNDNEEVIEVRISHDVHNQHPKLGGRMNMRFLPSTVRSLIIVGQDMEGTLEANDMPTYLETFNIRSNLITGELNVKDFPQTLTTLQVDYNALSGEIEWEFLPANLKNFDAVSNEFHGSILLTNLPSTLEVLNLSNNQFSGEINLLSLPRNLHQLSIGGNNLCGRLLFDAVPERLSTLQLSSNHFTGNIDFKRIIPNALYFSIRGNEVEGSLATFQEFLPNVHTLYVDKNMLSGEVPLSAIPLQIKDFCFQHNDFSGTFDFGGLIDIPESHEILAVNLAHNRFHGSAAFENLPRGLTILSIGHNAFEGSVALTTLPEDLTDLEIELNNFSGSLDLTHLPAALEQLNASGNNFSGGINLENLPEPLRKLDLSKNQLTISIGIEIFALDGLVINLAGNAVQIETESNLTVVCSE